jgi:hypothetical protein
MHGCRLDRGRFGIALKTETCFLSEKHKVSVSYAITSPEPLYVSDNH